MTLPIRRIARVAAVWILLVFSATAARADVVLQWNEIAVRTFTTQTPALNPFATARFSAIVQLAVFEAVNTITGDYQGYLGSEAAPTGLPISAPGGSSPEAAAIQAAYRVLFNYFGANAATATALNADLAASLALIPNGAAKSNGIAAGEAAAQALITLRASDGSSPLSNYLPTPLHPRRLGRLSRLPDLGRRCSAWRNPGQLGRRQAIRVRRAGNRALVRAVSSRPATGTDEQ